MNHALRFLDGSEDLTLALVGRYDPFLVTASVSVACVAGYAALLISERIENSDTLRARIAWLLCGAVAMGFGIWTMHFVGMLAFELPIPVAYAVIPTLVSVLPGMVGAAVALESMSRPRVRTATIHQSGLAMGAGIGAMHYTGMAAMVMPGHMLFSLPTLLLSLVVAYTLATFSLYMKVHLRRRAERGSPSPQWLSGIVLGLAIAGMHYTGMSSAVYFPGHADAVPGSVISTLTLGLTITVFTTGLLAIAIIATIVDRRLEGISLALRTSEAQNRLILENAREGILCIDDTGIVVSLNRAGAEIFGHAVGDVVGRNVSMLVPPAAATKHDEFISRYLAGEKSRVVGANRDLSGLHSSGREIVISLSVSEYAVEGRRMFAGIFRDLTETRRLESQLLQSEKLKSIGRLAAGIAHEINTPAQYVGDNLEFLDGCYPDLMGVFKKVDVLLEASRAAEVLASESQALAEAIEAADLPFLEVEIPRALGQSREGIQRVTKLVSAMKEFSHPGSNEKQATNLNRAIESTVLVASNEWKYVAEISTDFAPDLPLVPCFEAEFNQVVLNIVVNAAQAIGEQARPGGAKGSIEIRTRQEEDRVRIDIHDDGPGIPETIRSRIFDPFFTTKEVGKGTGQGLAIARSTIVDKHDGAIEVASSAEQGTTFTIRLPISSGSQSEDVG